MQPQWTPAIGGGEGGGGGGGAGEGGGGDGARSNVEMRTLVTTGVETPVRANSGILLARLAVSSASGRAAKVCAACTA